MAEKEADAAVGVEDELLARADVDGERRRIEAVEADARAVGGRREDLVAVAAVDLDLVDAGAALVEVGVVARVPDHPVTGLAEDLVVGVATGERVVLAAPEEQVEPAFAEQRVVLGLPEQHVAAGSAGQDVVARPTVEIGARQAHRRPRS